MRKLNGWNAVRSTACERLEDRRLLAANDVLISEFMAANDGVVRDQDGDSSDWIELYNNSNTPANLQGLILADSEQRWELPDIEMAPYGFQLVFASGKDRRQDELHTNFKLSSAGESLQLLGSDGTTVIHQYATYPEQQPDRSYGVAMLSGGERAVLSGPQDARYTVPRNNSDGLSWTSTTYDDQSWQSGRTGIGYETSGSNYRPLLNSTVPSGTPGFYSRIEFDVADLEQVSNLLLKMRYDDGFIAYLNGQRVADANGVASPRYNSTASGENADGDAVQFESFDISRFRELLQPSGNVLAIHALNRSSGSSDMLMFPELSYNLVGSTDASDVGYFPVATPAGINGDPVLGFTSAVEISLAHGFYTQPQQVTLQTSDAAATIRYTTNGSAPTENSGQLYSGPITIDSTTVLRATAFRNGAQPSPASTATYLFLDDVVNQTRSTTLQAGFPSSWNGVSADYGLDSKVIGNNDRFDGKYADSIRDDLQAIPTLSIVTGVDQLFGQNGIYANPTNSNLEEAASLEMIHPDGTQGFQIDAGLKIQGGAFRNWGLTKKKSFRFKFQQQYGPKKLDYPLFGPDAVDSFDTLTLRMEANDGWQWSSGDNTNRLFARDEWGRRTQLAMGQPGSHGTHAHVYLNGVYWGMYNVVERPDESFASDYIGGDKDDWDVQNSGRAIQGDLASWNELVRQARNVSNAANGSSAQLAAWMRMQGKNPDGSNNPQFESYLDVDNYIDYLIVNMYGGNSDWPHKNYYAGRQRGADSAGFQFFMWDSEWSLNLRSSLSTNRTNISDGIAQPYSLLKDVPEFQLRFADRVQQHFSPGGALYVDPVRSAWDPDNPHRNVPAARFAAITDAIRSPLVAESARWGDQHSGPYTVDESWEPHVQSMLEDYFPDRSGRVLSQFRRASLTSSVDTPEFSQPPGVLVGTDRIALRGEGQIYYTLDGTDPRLPGGGLSPSAQRYQSALQVTSDVRLQVRAKSGNNWSALQQGDFILESATASGANIAITEVHYNPADATQGEPDADNDEFEFLEVTNVSSQRVDLTDVKLLETEVDGDTQGVRFHFAAQTLNPGQSLVVVENVDAFRARYGEAATIAVGVDEPGDVNGQYGGKLSNGGEQLTLVAASGQTIRQFTYADDWYASTDGEGRSLVIRDANVQSSVELSQATAWRPSDQPNGTPGQFGEATSLPGDFNADGLRDRQDLELLYAAIGRGEQGPEFDLDQDGQLNQQDAQHWIQQLAQVVPGDATLDGNVNFSDFLALAQAFNTADDATWFEGDFNFDGRVAFDDFLILARNFAS